MKLPEVIVNQICQQINTNGDERVDLDEFQTFFLNVIMGSVDQKMFIAFKCFDI